jgi:hypothetical protein
MARTTKTSPTNTARAEQAQVDSILHHAHNLINGPRKNAYGSAAAEFSRVADYWTTHLYGSGKLLAGNLTAEDVAVMMTLLKIARMGHDPKNWDSLIDAAGYIGLIEQVREA